MIDIKDILKTTTIYNIGAFGGTLAGAEMPINKSKHLVFSNYDGICNLSLVSKREQVVNIYLWYHYYKIIHLDTTPYKQELCAKLLSLKSFSLDRGANDIPHISLNRPILLAGDAYISMQVTYRTGGHVNNVKCYATYFNHPALNGAFMDNKDIFVQHLNCVQILHNNNVKIIPNKI